MPLFPFFGVISDTKCGTMSCLSALLGFLIAPHRRRVACVGKQMSINQSDCKEFTQFTYFLSQKPDKAARKELIFLEQRQKVCYSCIVNLPPSLLLRCQFIDGSQIHTHNTHTDKCGRGAAHYFTRPQAKQWRYAAPRHATPRYACHMVNLSHMLYAFACVWVGVCVRVS